MLHVRRQSAGGILCHVVAWSGMITLWPSSRDKVWGFHEIWGRRSLQRVVKQLRVS
jgi:hypothetical protein